MFNKVCKIFLMGLLLSSNAVLVGAAEKAYQPEEGSAELDRKGGSGKIKVSSTIPNVLLIGDSISIGYTKSVQRNLKHKANVQRVPGNAQGTSFSLKKIDSWLSDTKWDVIHFNWGLHDLKHVKKAGTSENSNNPNDPYQATVEQYAINLEKLVVKLKASGAKLIFATTTPYPTVRRPYRDEKDAAIYNAAALKIMQANSIEVNNLHDAINPKLKKLQLPRNVHFRKNGNKFLAGFVTQKIKDALAK
jgi:hypothetical protein